MKGPCATNLKHRPRPATLELVSRLHRHGHELTVLAQIKQLTAVPPPSRLRPAATCNLYSLSVRRWRRVFGREGPRINLPYSRFVRSVNDPSTIRRELSVRLVEGALNHRERL